MSDTNQIEAVARQFSRNLLAYLGPEKLAEVDRLNKDEPVDGVCCSGDFLFMMEALETVLGKSYDEITEVDEDGTNALWNAAWNLAKTTGFVSMTA